jgi:hypothetical protein
MFAQYNVRRGKKKEKTPPPADACPFEEYRPCMYPFRSLDVARKNIVICGTRPGSGVPYDDAAMRLAR